MQQTQENTIRLTRIQKIIAGRMLESKQTKPCFYIELKADESEMLDMRHKIKRATKIKVTTNAFYIRALAISAIKFPLVLGKIVDNNIIIADSVNVGFAVTAPHGLVVPVIADAHKMTLTEIAQAEKDLVAKARANTLDLGDVSSETIALSNLGAYGIDSFIGIVPPPATVILSVGNTQHTPFPQGDTIVEHRLVNLTLAADSSIVNPDYAARFLSNIKTLLENPRQLT